MSPEAEILDQVIQDTISAIDSGKRQIFDIAEHSRTEYNRLEEELREIKTAVAELINNVDMLTKKEKKARQRLAEVSKDFKKYNEADIRKAYEEAQNKKIELANLKNKEDLLRIKRDYLETSLRKMKNLLKKAENLASHLTAITNYLTSSLSDVNSRFMELEQIQKLGVNIIRAQEEERRKVARDIHDGPAQSMANIIMRTEYCLKLLDINHAGVRAELAALQELVRKSLQDVRKIIFDLRPMVLDDLGLIPAVNQYLDEFRMQNGLMVETIILGESRRLAMPVEVALFRIVQESLSNIRKHAGASQIMVKIELLPQKILLIIKDNGKGFNLQEVLADKKREGYGLIGIRERIQILDGELIINTATGQGTAINIAVPLEDEDMER
jgi:two-component system sensor histidine kinase DegS